MTDLSRISRPKSVAAGNILRQSPLFHRLSRHSQIFIHVFIHITSPFFESIQQCPSLFSIVAFISSELQPEISFLAISTWHFFRNGSRQSHNFPGASESTEN